MPQGKRLDLISRDMFVCPQTRKPPLTGGNWPALSVLLSINTFTEQQHQTRPPVTATDRNKSKTIPQPYLSEFGHINIRTWSKPQKRPDVTSVLSVKPAKPVLSKALFRGAHGPQGCALPSWSHWIQVWVMTGMCLLLLG